MSKPVKMATGILLITLYVVGLVLMLTGQFSTGLTLWVLSTLGGIGFLYYNRQVDAREKAKQEARREKAEGE